MILKFLITLVLVFQVSFAKNLTEIYLKERADISKVDDSYFKKTFANTTIVMLPGILSETTIDGSKQPINVSGILGDYFKDYMDWLNATGLKNKRIIVESENSVSKNAIFIEKELLKIDGDLIIISHSKGGLEFLNVILNNKSIRDRTKTWVAMQAPFYGASVADILVKTPILRVGTGWVFTFLGGSIEGLSSVGTRERGIFHRKNKEKIRNALREINFIQYVTYIDNQFGPETPLEVTRDLIRIKRGRNDGLVEVNSAYLPFGDYIVESGVDHLATVVDFSRLSLIPLITRRYKNWHFSRVKHLKALLRLAR